CRRLLLKTLHHYDEGFFVLYNFSYLINDCLFLYIIPNLFIVKILIINGPNINLIGKREPDVYGDKSFDDFFVEMQFKFRDVELSHFQSNIEGEIIDKLQ